MHNVLAEILRALVEATMKVLALPGGPGGPDSMCGLLPTLVLIGQ